MSGLHFTETLALCNYAVTVADKLIEKVESGRARSVETYADMKILKRQAERLRDQLEG
jgi:hypothetical protein